jgi:hypothetical protein
LPTMDGCHVGAGLGREQRERIAAPIDLNSHCDAILTPESDSGRLPSKEFLLKCYDKFYLGSELYAPAHSFVLDQWKMTLKF